jgi:Peptidase C13 family
MKGGRVESLAAIIFLTLAVDAYAQDTHLVIITGVAGDQEHADKFQKWATTLIDAARRQDGVAADHITYLAERADGDPSRVRGRSTRENVEKVFGDLAASVRPADEVFVILIGHGSFDGRKAAFNLPGPDLTAEDYARLVAKLPAQRLVFVDTTSSSGAFLQPLAGPGRTIVTATKTGGERNETEFPQYFVEAFTVEAADKNRDGRVSVMEAFEYARARVAQSYQQRGLILTEHAALDDGSEGNLASTLFLQSPRARTAAIAATADPTLRALLEQKQALEDQIAALKARKNKMDPAEYDGALEKLVTDLALKTRAIQQLEGKKP